MNKQQLITARDLLIEARDAGANVQDAIDVIQDKIEALVEADPVHQQREAARAWTQRTAEASLWQ